MNKQIAAKLGITEITVKVHRGNMMREMGADSFLDLVKIATRLRLMPVTKAETAAARPLNTRIVPMTRYDIADYLALRVETVSRTLSALRRQGRDRTSGYAQRADHRSSSPRCARVESYPPTPGPAAALRLIGPKAQVGSCTKRAAGAIQVDTRA
jgi:DNA-binding CsgD family transcriptional regulator